MHSTIACIRDFIFVEDMPEKSDAILIAGGSIPQLAEKAASLYHQGMAPCILPSGGANPKLNGDATEWAYLRRILLDQQVPEEAILKEDAARHTFDNAALSLQALQTRGISVSRVLLVCKAYHARRALLTYQYAFPKEVCILVCPVPDRLGITKETWHLEDAHAQVVMNEVRKIGQYFQDKICGMEPS